MGECGCYHITYEKKITNKNGDAFIIGVYPSCRYCSGPAGVRINKVQKSDFYLYDIENIPELNNDAIQFDVIDFSVLKKHIEHLLIGHKPENNNIDDIEADVITEEIDLREIVSQSKEAIGWDY